ncbi:hypothetical protein RUM43_013580 [Polyplax serrata]|uniref:Uncharacterized protein n=1 Tax=Polyplax serrata TaxID=468196 RepID=A0AAN8PS94_POLSC
MSKIPQESLGEALEAAVREAVDDKTYRKVKRCSYAQTPQDTLSQLLGKGGAGGNSGQNGPPGQTPGNITDPAILDQLMAALLGQQSGQNTTPHQAFNRMRPMSRSMRHSMRVKTDGSRRSSWLNQNQGGGGSGSSGGNNSSSGQLPTIMEGSGNRHNASKRMSLSERALNVPIVRNVLQTISNVPQRLSTGGEDEESGRFERKNSDTPLTKD